MKGLVDNDVLFKGACYGLLSELVLAACLQDGVVGVLGSARFVVPNKIDRADLRRSRSGALETLSDFLKQVEMVEPFDEEQRMAADFELHAQRIGVSLDAGESQLCAILVFRMLPLLMTGDKRAIAAMERLLDADGRLAFIRGKVLCLEQAFVSVLARHEIGAVRGAVCGEPGIDKALTICFSCHSESVSPEDHLEGLKSYIQDLRSVASRVLAR